MDVKTIVKKKRHLSLCIEFFLLVLEEFREKVAHGGRSSKKDLQIKWSLPRPESLGNVEITWINKIQLICIMHIWRRK